MRPTLDQYLMSLAVVAATRTSCIRKGVGCVLADRRGRVLAIAYNGVPRGQPHCNEATGEFHRRGTYWTSMEPRYGHACEGHDLPPGQDKCEAVHAEQNAVLQCADTDLIHTAYVTTAPCRPCMKLLLNTGCQRIVFMNDHPGCEEVAAVWTKTGRLWEKM